MRKSRLWACALFFCIFSGGNFNMEKTNQSYLATEKIGKLMGKYAVPCIISLLVGALYNIVDQIFIANATYLGYCPCNFRYDR